MSDRRKQFRASFLAAIMVISMVGMGFAGFAGSAAALDGEDIADDGHSLSANPANATEENVTHTAAIGITDDSAGTLGNSTNVTFGYGDADNLDVSEGGVADPTNVSIEHIDDEGHNLTLFSDRAEAANISVNTDNDLEVELNFSAGEESIELEEGDVIRANLTNIIDHDGVETGDSVNIEFEDADIDVDPELDIGADAPIQLNDGDDGNFTSLHNATLAAGEDDEITLSGDVNEFLSNPANVTADNDGLENAVVHAAEVDIDGNNNDATFDSDGGTYIDFSDEDETNVSDITLISGESLGDNVVDTAIDTGNANDITIEGVTFDGFAGPMLDLGDVDEAVIDDVEFEGDTFDVNGVTFELTAVTERTLGDMTDADAIREGSPSLEEYKERMVRAHGGSFDWDDDADVVRHRFERVE